MKVEKEDQQNLRVRAPGVSHQAKAVPSGMRGHPRDRLLQDFRADALTKLTVPLEVCRGLEAVRPPVGEERQDLALSKGVGGHLQLLDGVGAWAYRIDSEARGLSTDEEGETAEVGEPPEDDDEEVVASTLPVLRVSCNSWVGVL
jgi:hypothetical protein